MHLYSTLKGNRGSINVSSLDGDASVVRRVAGYAATIPSGTRTPWDSALIETVIHKFPPALSPAKQTRSAVEPVEQDQDLESLWIPVGLH